MSERGIERERERQKQRRRDTRTYMRHVHTYIRNQGVSRPVGRRGGGAIGFGFLKRPVAAQVRAHSGDSQRLEFHPPSPPAGWLAPP